MDAASAKATDWESTDWDRLVAGFLAANPGWLADHGELYRTLAPPTRVHGDALADHMHAMLLRERRHATAMMQQAETVLAAGRAAATMLNRVHEAVLAVMAEPDPVEYLVSDLPRQLGADLAQLWTRSSPPPSDTAYLEGLLSGRDLIFRAAPPDATTLYKEGAALARHDALIRVPAIGVLGLASRDPLSTEPAQISAPLIFLGRAISAALIR